MIEARPTSLAKKVSCTLVKKDSAVYIRFIFLISTALFNVIIVIMIALALIILY